MRVRSLVAFGLFAALAVCAVAGWGWGWQERGQLRQAEFTTRRLAFIEAENRRLSGIIQDKARAEEEAFAAKERQEIERRVSDLRELPFREPVVYKQFPRSELPAVLRQKLAQQVPDKEFEQSAIAFAALGLIPAGVDLKKTYLDLLGEQIGAFFDQHTHELFTFSGQSLSNSQNRVILAHELTHALQDQNFGLANLPLEIEGNDDKVLAATALVEGDATLVMNRYMVGDLSASAIRDTLASALTTDVRQLAAAPRYLRETLLFPYLRGQEFCAALYETGGWSALSEAFRHPPTSSAQILHPAKYMAQPREEPVTVDLPGAAVLGAAPVAENVLGEFGARQWLTTWLKGGDAAANGWCGDRYIVYGSEAAKSYVWKSLWESAAAAEAFHVAALKCLSARYGQPIPPEVAATDQALHAFALGKRFVAVESTPAHEVVLVDAQDARWSAALQAQFLPKAKP